jgi:hypothetical protein
MKVKPKNLTMMTITEKRLITRFSLNIFLIKSPPAIIPLSGFKDILWITLGKNKQTR